MTAKQSAAEQKAKRDAVQKRERMGSTFRQFAYACRAEVPPGNYYEQSDEAREAWMAQAEVHARAMGLTT